jgi:hypothetical protein
MGFFVDIYYLFISGMNEIHLGGIDAEIENNLVPKIFHATKLSLVFWHNHLPLVLVDLKTNNPKGG